MAFHSKWILGVVPSFTMINLDILFFLLHTQILRSVNVNLQNECVLLVFD
jgi:hypothetical protein